MKWIIVTLSGLLLASPAFSNIIGSDHQNFNPANSHEDLITVFRPKTLGQGHFHLGLHANYGVNTLPYFEDPEGESREDKKRNYNDAISAMDLTMSLGLTDRWDIGLTLPYFVSQTIIEETGFRGQFSKMGNTEIRVNSKFNVLQHALGGFALVGTANYNRVKNNPYTGNEEWPAFSLELLADVDFQIISLAANFGHRWRKAGDAVPIEGEVAIEPFRNQWIFSGGVNVPIPAANTELISEVYGSYTEKDIASISSRNASILEGILALRFKLPHDFYLQMGIGSELRHAISSADERYFAGVTWNASLPKRKPAPIDEEALVLSSQVQQGVATMDREPDEIIVIEDVLFEFDSDEITGEPAYDTLQKLARIFNGSRKIELVVIAGHACAIGSEVYNLDLSERRSESIVDWLVGRYQVLRERVVPVGFGKMMPTISNQTEPGRRRNRRVEFEIYYEKTVPQTTAAR
ncbi:MAG: OmpA family protein [Oligoflexus sp.]